MTALEPSPSSLSFGRPSGGPDLVRFRRAGLLVLVDDCPADSPVYERGTRDGTVLPVRPASNKPGPGPGGSRSGEGARPTMGSLRPGGPSVSVSVPTRAASPRAQRSSYPSAEERLCRSLPSGCETADGGTSCARHKPVFSVRAARCTRVLDMSATFTRPAWSGEDGTGGTRLRPSASAVLFSAAGVPENHLGGTLVVNPKPRRGEGRSGPPPAAGRRAPARLRRASQRLETSGTLSRAFQIGTRPGSGRSGARGPMLAPSG